MAWRRRGRGADDPTVAEGERVLARTTDREGRPLLGTDAALYLPDGRRLPWERVDTARWDREAERLVVVEVADFGEPQPRTEIELTEPGRLLELVRERVTASVLLTRSVPVTDSTMLKVVARRSPTGRGEIDWSFWLPPGLDPDDPAVRAAADAGLADAQRELGDGGFASA